MNINSETKILVEYIFKTKTPELSNKVPHKTDVY